MLLEDVDWVAVRVSESTESAAVVMMVLGLFPLPVTHSPQYSLFEEIQPRRYIRRLSARERPLRLQRR